MAQTLHTQYSYLHRGNREWSGEKKATAHLDERLHNPHFHWRYRGERGGGRGMGWSKEYKGRNDRLGIDKMGGWQRRDRGDREKEEEVRHRFEWYIIDEEIIYTGCMSHTPLRM